MFPQCKVLSHPNLLNTALACLPLNSKQLTDSCDIFPILFIHIFLRLTLWTPRKVKEVYVWKFREIRYSLKILLACLPQTLFTRFALLHGWNFMITHFGTPVFFFSLSNFISKNSSIQQKRTTSVCSCLRTRSCCFLAFRFFFCTFDNSSTYFHFFGLD